MTNQFHLKLIILLTILFCSSFVHASDLNKTVFNPHPMEDDLVLPLPCNNSAYSIVFRKVYTNSADDTDITNSFEFIDGSDEDARALTQSKRTCKVRGNFHDDKGYFFYISKYELTQGQYNAITQGKCKSSPSKMEALPIVNISYQEAIDAANKYSDFLQTIEQTPTFGNEKAYATLPYECYWSFAQRGGLLVSKTDLEMESSRLNLKDYAWYSGADSSNEKLQLIGLKQPNDLGLFDMLGNAQEYMAEPFQAVGVDGLAGQKGGSTVRGGSFRTQKNYLTNSLRSERKNYTNGSPTKSNDTGTRLMLNVSVTHDPRFLNQARADVQKRMSELQDRMKSLETENPQKNHAEIEKLKLQIKELDKKLSSNEAELKKEKKAQDYLIKRNAALSQNVTNNEKPILSLLVVTLGALGALAIILISIAISKKSKSAQAKEREAQMQAYINKCFDNQQKTSNKKQNRFSYGFLNKNKK